MSEKPQRSWFQIHLSTALVMMVVAGVLIKENIVETVSIENDNGREIARTYERGWPLSFTWHGEIQNFGVWEVNPQRLFINGLIFDLFASLAILVTVFVALERFIRRREGRAR